jgi:hypothetical protein
MRPSRTAVVAGLLLAMACSQTAVARADAGSERRALDRAKARWARQHIRSYSYRLRVKCTCPARERRAVRIVVHNGRTRGARGFQRRLDTVSELFREIGDALANDFAGENHARYSPRRGYPVSARLDPNTLAVNDEFSFTVDRFRVLP